MPVSGRRCRVIEAVGAADPSVALVLSQHLLFHAVLSRPDNPWPVDVRRARPAIHDRRRRPDQLAAGRAGAGHAGPGRPPGDGRRAAARRSRLAPDRSQDLLDRHPPAALAGGLGPDRRPGAPRRHVPRRRRRHRATGSSETWDHLGMRATRSDDVIFEGAEIPLDHAVALSPAGTPAAEARDPWFLAWNNLVIASIYNGVARSARDWLVGYLNERTPTNLGAPLATLPRFQAAVGEIEALLYANERLIHGTADEVDDGPDSERRRDRLEPREARRRRPTPSAPSRSGSRSSATPASPATTRSNATTATCCAAASTRPRTTPSPSPPARRRSPEHPIPGRDRRPAAKLRPRARRGGGRLRWWRRRAWVPDRVSVRWPRRRSSSLRA